MKFRAALTLAAAFCACVCMGRAEAAPKAIPVGGGESVARAIPAPTGPKKLIAVSKFENKASWQGQWRLDDGMTEQLTDALMQSGRFIVLERQDISSVIEEQDFGVTGRTTKQGGAQIGQINRAQILVKGAITEFEENTTGGGQGVRIKGFTIGGSSGASHVAIIIYLIDSTTGQIIESQRCEGAAESGGMAFGYSESDFGFGSGEFKKTPLGKAVQMAIDQAVEFISIRMSNLPWAGKIILAKETGDVYINAGKDAGIRVGDQFSVYRPGEALVDPDSGLDLGSEETRIGRVEVSQVKDKFSIAVPVSGSGFAKMDVVRFE